MLVSDFHYHLPQELIAQEPLADRAGSRLLHVDRKSGEWSDRQFQDLPQLLRSGDVLILNNTRVFPARLYGHRAGVNSQPVSRNNPAAREFLRGRVEVLLTKQISQSPNEWECLVRPGRKIGVGEKLFFGERNELEAEVADRGPFGERRIRFESAGDFFDIVERIGHVPLPPYISRADSSGDRERYQTVYANELGSVAAPTAGLHFTPEILWAIRNRGVEIVEITLHVGLGTFQPIHAERVEDHRIHAERYSITPEATAAISRARREARRLVAVGTTTVRTLEHLARKNAGEIVAGAGEADLFIYPGYQFQIVNALLTNFHLPQSTLLMLVSAFAGRENVLRAYAHAVADRYRFYSYGDCMLIE